MYKKYPRTLHLPWSPGRSDDDKVLDGVEHFVGKEIIVTEKLDGENTTMYRDHIHARSIDSKHHPSRTWVKAEHGRIQSDIPEGWRICGENVYAKHSIHYRGLTAYFYVFGIYNDQDLCLSWNDTEEYATLLGLQMAPVLYRGSWDEKEVRDCWTGESCYDAEQEGYVVRLASSFKYEDFAISAAKFVRAHHVQTDEFWMSQPVVPNLLAPME
jgi:hypothetical protein